MHGYQTGRICYLGEYPEMNWTEDLKRRACRTCICLCLSPESLLEKEKDHVEGFAPEVAWVTMGGLEPLQERDVRKTDI